MTLLLLFASTWVAIHLARGLAAPIKSLAEASKDARTRAVKMLESAGGGKLGKLLDANMGVININPANSTAVSWEGNNDTTTLEKDIITTATISYELL